MMSYMIHEILPVGPLQCNCSIVGDENSHEAIVIDPGDDIEAIMEIVARHGLQVKQIVVTHAHIDHVGGAMKIKQRTGAPILLNQNDSDTAAHAGYAGAWLGMRPPGKVAIDQSITSGDSVKAGAVEGKVLHTPGHTEGSICLYFEPEKRLVAGERYLPEALAAPICRAGHTTKSFALCTRACWRCLMKPWWCRGTAS